MSNPINVCLSCDDNYVQHAGVVIASILANANDSDDLHFYILNNGISQEQRNKLNELKNIKNFELNFVDVDENNFEDYKSVSTHKYITLPSYYRLKFPSIFPYLDRVIYFDCDVVVNTSLSELFNIEIKNYPVAGAPDIDKKDVKRNPTCVNSGVLIMDLKNMREQNIEQKFLEWTKVHINTIKKGDQEILNETLKGNVLIIDKDWNVQSSNFTNRSSYTNAPKIIHFVAKKKPWHYASFSVHRDLYFKYLQLTPWKLNEKDYKHWTKDNQIASLFAYVKYRPFFAFRPKFYKALYFTYIHPLFTEKRH